MVNLAMGERAFPVAVHGRETFCRYGTRFDCAFADHGFIHMPLREGKFHFKITNLPYKN